MSTVYRLVLIRATMSIPIKFILNSQFLANADSSWDFNSGNQSCQCEFWFWYIWFGWKLWVQRRSYERMLKLTYSVRDGLKIKQSEWNIVKIGNSANAGKCIKARYKNIHMETVDANSSKTISIMSNGVIDVSSTI